MMNCHLTTGVLMEIPHNKLNHVGAEKLRFSARAHVYYFLVKTGVFWPGQVFIYIRFLYVLFWPGKVLIWIITTLGMINRPIKSGVYLWHSMYKTVSRLIGGVSAVFWTTLGCGLIWVAMTFSWMYARETLGAPPGTRVSDRPLCARFLMC